MAQSTSLTKLKSHLERLPTELQDEIKLLTLSVPQQTTIPITPDYLPPPQLHLSRETRALALKEYYTTNNIQVDLSIENLSDLARFLRSVPAQEPVKYIRVRRAEWTSENGFGRVRSLAMGELWDVSRFFQKAGVQVKPGNLWTNIRSEEGEGEEEWCSLEMLFKGSGR